MSDSQMTMPAPAAAEPAVGRTRRGQQTLAALTAAAAGVRRLRPAEEMLHALHRQRLVADRTGRGFAWVVFEPAVANGAERLGQHLVRRVRATDEVGVAPAEACGDSKGRGRERPLMVVLPETGDDGADRFVQSVRGLYKGEAPQASVFVYDAGPGADEEDGGRIELRASRADDGLDGLLPRGPMTVGRREVGTFAKPLRWWKRGLDVTTAAAGLVLLSPLLMLIALAIRLDSRGGALFWQPRAGRGGRVFKIAKFRTMVADAEARKAALKSSSEQDGPAFKLRRDPRVTRVGLILRSTSLDELPQLWNVLRGDMTLVGPRPLPVAEAAECKPWQRRRLDVTPGLTCIWQVHGRSRVSFEEWMRMDLKYVRRHSSPWGPVHDLTLLAKTLPAVFLKRGF